MVARVIGGRVILGVPFRCAMRYGVLRTSVGPRFARFEGGRRARCSTRAPWLGGKRRRASAPRRPRTRSLCPVAPSKIVCIGRNYAAHAKELGNEVPSEPLLFLKPPSALLDPGGTVRLPPESARVEHEAELAVVIGKRAKNVAARTTRSRTSSATRARATSPRATCRSKDVQFTRAKGFDTFCPIGPWIETELDPGARARALRRRTAQTRQDGSDRRT